MSRPSLPAHRTAHPQRGLTLLEMIIALLLLSLLLMLLFGGMRLASRSWDRGDAYTSQVTRMQIVEEFLRREIEQVTPYRDAATRSVIYPGVQSSSDELRFAYPMPAAGGHGGLYALRIGLADSRHGKALMLWRTPLNAPVQDDAAANQPVLLADRVAELHFSYFGPVPGSPPNAPAQWQDTWSSTTQMPLLVRMQVKLADGRSWPDLIAAPHIAPQAIGGR